MMKLAKIIKRDDYNYLLRDGTPVNPPVGTIVRYTYDVDNESYVVYFPGYTAGCYPILSNVFMEYFKDLTDETGEDN